MIIKVPHPLAQILLTVVRFCHPGPDHSPGNVASSGCMYTICKQNYQCWHCSQARSHSTGTQNTAVPSLIRESNITQAFVRPAAPSSPSGVFGAHIYLPRMQSGPVLPRQLIQLLFCACPFWCTASLWQRPASDWRHVPCFREG